MASTFLFDTPARPRYPRKAHAGGAFGRQTRVTLHRPLRALVSQEPMAPPSRNTGLSSIAADMIDTLSRQFPVCLASDEFHFFPQAAPTVGPGAAWDDFSGTAIEAACRRLARWQSDLRLLEKKLASRADRFDASVYRRIAATLEEQLTLVGVHRRQPTFHLTVIAIGLAETLEKGREELRRLRIEALPAFVDRARDCLDNIPSLFLAPGLEMTGKLVQWLDRTGAGRQADRAAVAALEHFARHLRKCRVSDAFRVEPDLYARIAGAHIGCDMTVEAIATLLEEEIEETRRILNHESGRLAPGRPWQETVKRLEVPLLADSAESRYRGIIDDLARHCVEHRLTDAETAANTPIRVMPVPDHLSPVRSVAAYSMPPGHPPRGGTFFTDPGRSATMPGDWKLLAAHETYPGHHMLDAHRWNLERKMRRHVEFPLFYEGWASFSEEILFDTGFFSETRHRFLMAKRRFWRAVRGKVDVALHWGQKSVEGAAALLATEGMDGRLARVMVRRYALKPGYQLSYTVGRRRFKELYHRWTSQGGDPGGFVRTVMAEGEIGFDALEKTLFDGSGKGAAN